MALVVVASKAIIRAAEDALSYHPRKNHPPPDLWIDDENYLVELRQLVTELQKLNAYLEAHRAGAKKSAVEVTSARRYLDSFLKEFAPNFGKSFGKALGTTTGCLVAANIASIMVHLGVNPALILKHLAAE